ncbi:MAG TPA: alcohol dehydrogenase catalytic domain-containing protein [Gaiellales bacterium]|jgi:alcohol dehydrogenase
MPGTYRSMQVDEAGADFQLVEQPTPEPGRGQVRIAIEANGICHSDAMITSGHMPGTTFPCVTGHEMAGRVDAIGEGVEGFELGQRVGVGWFGGNCGRCVPCREGDAINCAELQIPGVAYPGGFADAAIVPATALARIPDGLSAAEAAPMGCAGVTVFNALRRSVARPGDLVAILGVGGLGHLGVQFASKLGFETVAIARGADKETLARELGADHYIDASSVNVAQALQALGGAKVVLATVTSSAAMSAVIDGLTHRGELIVVGVDAAPIEVSPFQLVGGCRKVYGHASGTSRDVEETLHFAALHGVRPLVEEARLEDAGEAFAKMLSGEARFRMVLTTGR